MLITDYLVQERMTDEADNSCLHRPLFPVNMRLLKSSPRYRLLVEDVLHYMEWIMGCKWDDYGSAQDGGTFGISGANLGVPFNIIGYRLNGQTHLMLNPLITDMSDETATIQSNCGSLRLPKKIWVLRHVWVDVQWHTPEGELRTGRFTRENGGYTIQHEIDHNNGILITDRAVSPSRIL